MAKRSVVLIALAAIMLSAAWSAGEELTYSGPFVSVNSPLKLCATATDDNGPVAGVGLWFQAWTVAGVPRTNGPMTTAFTNVLGKACSQYNLNEGLYEVQAFGTGPFDGIASDPVVVCNWKTGMSIEATSAGIATYRLGNLGPTCEAVFGLHLDHGVFFTANVVRTAGRFGENLVSARPGVPVEFLWLDKCNPAGPTRIQIGGSGRSTIVLLHADVKANMHLLISGFAFVTVGDTSFMGWMEFRVDTGDTWRLQPITAPEVCGASGMFTLLVRRLNGQIIYDVSGPFRGTTCAFFPPP